MSLSFSNPPEFLSLPIFGLDISASSIKLTKLKRVGSRLLPQHIVRVALSETCELFSGQPGIVDCQETKKALVQMRKKYKVRMVRVSIPEEKTYVFKALIPNDALQNVEEFVMYNLDQYVPLNPQEVIFDYKILRSHKGDATTPVVVTAIPRIVIEQYTALIESAGMAVVACEPETHAIARAVIHEDDLNPYIIINVDSVATNISVVEEGLVQYTQTLPVAASDLAGSITGPVAAALKEGVNRVIVYWFTSKDQQHHGARIENIILTGEGVNSPNIINFLESNLSVNASFGNVWKNCFSLNDYIPQISKQESLQYSTCVGLGLAKLK